MATTKSKERKEGNTLIFFSVLDSLNISRPVTEYVFHPTRKWRFDYAFPEQKIAL